MAKARAAREALGLRPPFTRSDVERAFKVVLVSRRIHPDHGGSADAFCELVRQRDLCLRDAS